MFVDVNCSLGTWPFFPSPIRNAQALARHLESEAVDAALVSSIDALFVADPDEQNRALADELAAFDTLYPIPVVNVRTKKWSTELDTYLEAGDLRAVKIHPNYHNYQVSDPELAALAQKLAAARVPLIVGLRVADERLHNPQMKVPGVPIDAVVELARAHPSLSVVCTNAYRNEIVRSDAPENVYFDIAFAEYYKTLDALAAHVAPTNLLFGSHTPFFVTRAANMKIAWSELDERQRQRVASQNAKELFGLVFGLDGAAGGGTS